MIYFDSIYAINTYEKVTSSFTRCIVFDALTCFIFMPVNSTRVAVSNQLCLSRLALCEALEPLQVQTFGLKISRSTYATTYGRINLRPESESVFLIESVLLKFCSIENVRASKCPQPKSVRALKNGAENHNSKMEQKQTLVNQKAI